jgi:hypothetical protein
VKQTLGSQTWVVVGWYGSEMSQVQIRQANEADIPTICQLQQQWFEEDCVYGFVPASSQQVQSALGPFF